MPRTELARIGVPLFGVPEQVPTIPAAEYAARSEAVRARMASAGLDVLVVYGDREHFANMAYLTGYDPRFEESLLIIRRTGLPVLVVGNEGWGYASVSPLDLDVRLYQSFSLLGMDRSKSPPLAALLADCGIGRGMRIGVAGWKYFEKTEAAQPEQWLDAPAFIVDTLRRLSGDRRRVTNATALFMHPQDGLRAVNSAAQLAVCECGGSFCSQSMRDLLAAVQPGMTGLQAVQLMRLNGLPLSCHPMLSSGERTALGLASPSGRILQRGEILMAALGVQGGLITRGGYLVESAEELPSSVADYVDVVVGPYYGAVVAWWESIGIGVSAAEVNDRVCGILGPLKLGPALNPGHLLHLDEWVHSPFFAGSPYRLRSGMILQSDIIPTAPAPYGTTNAEDGLALADEALRAELAGAYPAAWKRIQQRRRFMIETLGIRLKPEVLPFSNLPAVLFPYVLQRDLAVVPPSSR